MSKDILEIICKKHGIFKKSVQKFITDKQGCPRCKRGRKQYEIISFLQKIQCPKIKIDDRTAIKPFEIDCYLASLYLGFEFNGTYWHSTYHIKDKLYHFNKTKRCMENGIKLINIFEDDWENKRDILKNYIKNLMFINNNLTINASKCEIKTINNETKRSFLRKNSLFRKHSKTNYNLGLFYQNVLVFVYCMNLEDDKCNLVEIAEKNDLNMLLSIEILKLYLFKNTNIKKISHDLDLSLFFKFEEFLHSGFKRVKLKRPKVFYLKKYKIYDCGYIHFLLEKDIMVE